MVLVLDQIIPCVSENSKKGENCDVGNMLLLLLSHFSCVQLCVDPMDCSLPGSSIHGIFQARVLEWVAIAFSREYANMLKSRG